MEKIIMEAALQLLNAEKKREPIPPITELYPNLTVEHAYRIQLEIARRKLSDGRSVVGKKVGLTSQAMQQMLGVGEPDYGHLFDDMVLENGAKVKADELISPRIEAEIGFVLGRDLYGPHVTFMDVLMATEYVVPTLEIIDSRIADWKIKLVDTVADNGSSAKAGVGTKRSILDGLDLRTAGMVLHKNGQIAETGAGAAALGHPAHAIAWLVNKLSEYEIGIKAGELVLPGALSAAVPVAAGDRIEASFGALGSVSVSFV